MSKMRYFSNKIFENRQVMGALARPQRSINFRYCWSEVRDSAKLCCFKLMMAKSNFWKISY